MNPNPPFIYNPPNDPLDVLHLDDQLLAINKPSGLLSVPGKAIEHRDCLEARVKDAFPHSLLVHRLDMDTSGVMVFAHNKVAQRHLGSQFAKRQLKKTYVACVAGVMVDDEGTVDLPLIVDWPNRPKQKVCHETGKPSVTNWSVLDRNVNSTRVELRPVTGRSHQLRVHMLEIGHPILGDRFYGTAADIAASDRLLLHAERIQLRHPDGGAWIDINAPCQF